MISIKFTLRIFQTIEKHENLSKSQDILNYSPERRRKNWEERIVDLNFSPQKKQSRKKTLEKAVASVDPAAISIQAQMSLLRFLPSRVNRILELQGIPR